MSIDTTSTLSDIVTAQPAAARVFERRGLDYCCHGGRRLVDACVADGIDLDAVVDELEVLAPAAPEAWTSLDLAALVDHIETTHHRYLHDELPRLTALADKVTAAHGTRHPELTEIRSTIAALRADLEPHLAKEERVLFPMIRELAAGEATTFHCGSLRNPISVMLREHDQAGELLAQLRRQTNGFEAPADGCASYRALFAGLAELEADTHTHVHKENHALFPLVLEAESAVRSGS